MTTRAKIETKNAPLSSDFGRDYLFRKFDKELAEHILATFGIYQKGKHAGEQRGYIVWEKCHSGGWATDRFDRGYVQKPGSFDVRVSLIYGGEGGAAIYADECAFREPAVDDELREVATHRGIDVGSVIAASRAAHMELVMKNIADAHATGKRLQAAAWNPSRY